MGVADLDVGALDLSWVAPKGLLLSEEPAKRSDDPFWERGLVHIQHCSDHRRGDLAAGHHDTDPTFDIRRRAESAPTGSRMPSRPPRRVGPKLIVTRKPFPTRSHTKAPTHD